MGQGLPTNKFTRNILSHLRYQLNKTSGY